MVKLNLQLFAHKIDAIEELAGGTKKNTSNYVGIVDYLNGQGQDSSYAARKELANSLGIENYSGTADQNNQLLAMLKNGQTSNTQNIDKNTSVNASSGSTGGSSIHGVNQATVDKMNSTFQTSTAYQDAMKYTNELLQQLSSGRTSYTDQIKDLMDQIQNRDPFEYDVDKDVLFQQYLASSMASGKTAMQDTIGQASALTGGYGSSYATSAGNQQYNAYIQDAYNNLPEYYQMAMEAYQMEGEEMYNQLSMLNQADITEYQRLYDSWNANFSNAQTMYQNEYQKWSDEVANAFNYAGLANSDYWNNANYQQSAAQFEREMGYKYAALNQANEQWQKEYEMSQQEMTYKYDINGDGKVDINDKKVSDTPVLEDPNETQMKKALDAYNTGGMDELNKYLNSLPSNVNKDRIAEYVGNFGAYDTKENPLPYDQRTYTKQKDTWNGFLSIGSLYGRIDPDDVVVDHYGNPYTLEQLEAEGLAEDILEALSKLDEEEKWSRK